MHEGHLPRHGATDSTTESFPLHMCVLPSLIYKLGAIRD